VALKIRAPAPKVMLAPSPERTGRRGKRALFRANPDAGHDSLR